MEGLRHKILYTAFGASSGLAGFVSVSRCSGNTCTYCFGCAGMGIGILLIVLLNKFRKITKWDRKNLPLIPSLARRGNGEVGQEGNDGMA